MCDEHEEEEIRAQWGKSNDATLQRQVAATDRPSVEYTGPDPIVLSGTELHMIGVHFQHDVMLFVGVELGDYANSFSVICTVWE